MCLCPNLSIVRRPHSSPAKHRQPEPSRRQPPTTTLRPQNPTCNRRPWPTNSPGPAASPTPAATSSPSTIIHRSGPSPTVLLAISVSSPAPLLAAKRQERTCTRWDLLLRISRWGGWFSSGGVEAEGTEHRLKKAFGVGLEEDVLMTGVGGGVGGGGGGRGGGGQDGGGRGAGYRGRGDVRGDWDPSRGGGQGRGGRDSGSWPSPCVNGAHGYITVPRASTKIMSEW